MRAYKSRSERGMALAVAIFALVVVASLVAMAFYLLGTPYQVARFVGVASGVFAARSAFKSIRRLTRP